MASGLGPHSSPVLFWSIAWIWFFARARFEWLACQPAQPAGFDKVHAGPVRCSNHFSHIRESPVFEGVVKEEKKEVEEKDMMDIFRA